MQKNQSIVENPLPRHMDELLDRFGLLPLVAALVGASLRRRQMRNLASNLSPQMRRDIGLPEEDIVFPQRLTLWDIRV